MINKNIKNTINEKIREKYLQDYRYMKKQKQFILGVGCQKGGTSWLYAQVCRNPYVDMGFEKEYHIFDSIYLEDGEVFLERELKKLEKSISDKSFLEIDKNLLKHLSFYVDTHNYFEYFNYLYLRNDDITTVGEITPSYSGLPVEAFNFIKKELNKLGFTVKIIFLMRDPIERCHSMVRTYKRNGTESLPEITALGMIYKNKTCEYRTRYERTIKNLETVFPQEDIFYGIYEKLFTLEEMQRLSRFLNLEITDPNFNKKVNGTVKNQTLPSRLAKNIAEFYKETYLFCDSRFQTRSLWQGYQYLE